MFLDKLFKNVLFTFHRFVSLPIVSLLLTPSSIALQRKDEITMSKAKLTQKALIETSRVKVTKNIAGQHRAAVRMNLFILNKCKCMVKFRYTLNVHGILLYLYSHTDTGFKDISLSLTLPQENFLRLGFTFGSLT